MRGTPERCVLVRGLAVNQRIYLLVAEAPDSASISAHARRFADSFKIPGTAPAAPNPPPKGPAQGGAAQGGSAGEQPSIVLSNVTLSRKDFFPRVALDYRFERGAPTTDVQFHLVVTAASGKSYDQLLAISDKTAKLNQDMLQLPKTEHGPFKVHIEMIPVIGKSKPVKISNVVTVD